MSDDFYTVNQTAAEFHTTPRTIQRWCEAGRFPNARRINPAASRSPFLIPYQDIQTLKRELLTQPANK